MQLPDNLPESTLTFCKNFKTEDELIDKLLGDTDHLITFFEKAAVGKWQKSNASLMNKIITTINQINEENKISQNQIDKISKVVMSFYASANKPTKDKLQKLFEKQDILNFEATGKESRAALEKIIEKYGLNIQKLDLRECGDEIDNKFTKKLIAKCPNLQHLSIHSKKITNEAIRGLPNLTKLTHLDLSGCTSLTELTSLSKLKRLKFLTLKGCISIAKLPGISALFRLIHLDLSNNILIQIPNIDKLTDLEVLNLSGCIKLKKFPNLSKQTKLKTLYLAGCQKPKELPDHSEFDSLSKIDLSNCNALKEKDKQAILLKIFKKNFKRGLQLSKGFKLKDSSSIGKYIAANNDIDVVDNLTELIKYLDLGALTHLAYKVAKGDIEAFLKNIDSLSAELTKDEQASICEQIDNNPRINLKENFPKLIKHFNPAVLIPLAIKVAEKDADAFFEYLDKFSEIISIENAHSIYEQFDKTSDNKLKAKFLKKYFEHIRQNTEINCSYEKSGSIRIDLNEEDLIIDGELEKIISQITTIFSELDFKLYITTTGSKEVGALDAFIEKYGQSIEKMDLRKNGNEINNKFIKKLKEKCPNLHQFYMQSTLEQDEYLTSLQELTSLTHLGLYKCIKLKEFADQNWLKNLTYFDPRGCTKLKMPNLSEMTNLSTESLKEYLHLLSNDDMETTLQKILMKDLELGLKLLKSIRKRVAPELLNSIITYNNIDVVANLHTFTKYLNAEELTPIAIKVANRDITLFLNNLDKFSIKDIEASPLEKSVELKKLFSYKIDKELVLEAKTEEAKGKTFEDVPGVEIDDLLNLFEEINFLNKDAPGYIDPSKLLFEGRLIPQSNVKKGLKTIIQRIKKNQHFSGLPTDKDKRKEWYKNLELILKNIIKLMNEEEDKTLVARELINLSGLNIFCSPRWLGGSIEVYKGFSGELEGDLKSQGTEPLIASWLNAYKENLVSILTELIREQNSGNPDIHLFNFIAKVLNDNKIALPDNILLGADDPYIGGFGAYEGEIIKGFNYYVSPLMLVQYIKSKIDDTCKKSDIFIGDIADILRTHAEKNLLDEKTCRVIAEIEERNKDNPILLKGEKDSLLDDILEEQGMLIIDNDVTFAPCAITMAGTMAFLEYLGYIKY